MMERKAGRESRDFGMAAGGRRSRETGREGGRGRRHRSMGMAGKRGSWLPLILVKGWGGSEALVDP